MRTAWGWSLPWAMASWYRAGRPRGWRGGSRRRSCKRRRGAACRRPSGSRRTGSAGLAGEGATPARQIYSGLSAKRGGPADPLEGPDLGLVPAEHVLLLATVQGPKVPSRQPFTLQSSTGDIIPARESAAAEAARKPGEIRLPTAGMRVQAWVSFLNPSAGVFTPGRNLSRHPMGLRCQALGLPPLAHGGRRDRHLPPASGKCGVRPSRDRPDASG